MRGWGLLPFGLLLCFAEGASEKTCDQLSWVPKNGTVCGSSKFGEAATCAPKAQTKTEAQTFCQAQGARLCTLPEINAGVVAGSGCNLDTLRIWTSTVCQTTKFFTVGGAGANAPNGVKGLCADPGTQSGVRCCADAGAAVVAPTPTPEPTRKPRHVPSSSPTTHAVSPSSSSPPSNTPPHSPTPASTSSSAPSSRPSSSANDPSVKASVTFNLPFSLISNDTHGTVDTNSTFVKAFDKNFSHEFGRAVSIADSRVIVTALRKGSVITEFSIVGAHDSTEKSATDANNEMAQLVANPSSRLYNTDFSLFSHADPNSYHTATLAPSPTPATVGTTPTAPPPTSTTLSGGAIAAIVIAIVIVLLLCLLSCFFPGKPRCWAWRFCRIWGSQRMKRDSTPNEYDPGMHKSSTFVHVQPKGSNVQMAENQHLIHKPDHEATGRGPADPDEASLVMHAGGERRDGETNKAYWASNLGDAPSGPGGPPAPPPDPSTGFPRSDSEMVVRDALSHAPPAPKHPPEETWALSLFDFHTDDSEDLSFKAHQWIKVISQDLDVGEEWWMGELEDGRSGTFPYTYVRLESVLQNRAS